MKEVEQENQTGKGWVIYWKGMERRSGNEGMGRFAEVYDARNAVFNSDVIVSSAGDDGSAGGRGFSSSSV